QPPIRTTHLGDHAMPHTFEDIRYEIEGPVAVITINRPERYNAFRGRTVEELIKAFRSAWADRSVQVIILTGEGQKAFCTGGDVKQRAETGDYGPSESGMFEIGNLHKVIRDVPKPVIAAVNGPLVDYSKPAAPAVVRSRVADRPAGWPPSAHRWPCCATPPIRSAS